MKFITSVYNIGIILMLLDYYIRYPQMILLYIVILIIVGLGILFRYLLNKLDS
jgi:hypothetical protein